MTAVFWRPDPVWDRLHRQRSWGRLLRDLSLVQGVAVECKYTAITGGYHCQLFTNDDRHRYLCEGYGAHPLGAIRDALTLIESVKPVIRSKLLEALIDYLVEEIERGER